MATKFKHRGVLYISDTPEEAAKLTALLHQQSLEDSKRAALGRAVRAFGHASVLDHIEREFSSPWTPELFLAFVDRLGPAQTTALHRLLGGGSITDTELRQTVDVQTNQALAGVLSGISKQAAALGIAARDVFTLRNVRSEGRRSSTYSVSEMFREIASKMNWPAHNA